MKAKQGDVLVCKTHDCQVQLTVTHDCISEACAETCDIEATCCNQPMELKE